MGNDQNAAIFYGVRIATAPNDPGVFERPVDDCMPEIRDFSEIEQDSEMWDYREKTGNLCFQWAGNTENLDTYIAIQVSVIETHWEKEIVKGDLFGQGPAWDSLLREFCTRHNIPWSEPKWLLTAHYG